MANVALSALLGGGVKSIQTKYVSATSGHTKGDANVEDSVYWDLTLDTAVSDYTKCVVICEGGLHTSTSPSSIALAWAAQRPSARLTANDTLRISAPAADTGINMNDGDCAYALRYYVIEYN